MGELSGKVAFITGAARGQGRAHAVKLALADLEEPVEQTPEASEGYDEIAEIRKALTQSRGRYSDAAKILGMGRTTLWRKIRQYGLK